IFGMVAHGVITGMLFFEVGSIYDRYHTRQIAEIGGGMMQKMPALAGIFAFTAIASLGLPGLAGFWGEVTALLSSYSPAQVLGGRAPPASTEPGHRPSRPPAGRRACRHHLRSADPGRVPAPRPEVDVDAAGLRRHGGRPCRNAHADRNHPVDLRRQLPGGQLR